MTELLVLVLVRLEHERHGEWLRCRRFACLYRQRREGRETGTILRRCSHVTHVRFAGWRRRASNRDCRRLPATEFHLPRGKPRGPIAAGKFQRQLNRPLPRGVITNLQRDLLLPARLAIDRAAVRRQQPAVFRERKPRFRVGRPASHVALQIALLPSRDAVNGDRRLRRLEMQPPRHSIALLARGEAVRRLPAFSGLERGDEPALCVEHLWRRRAFGQTGHLNVERFPSRHEAHVARPLRTRQHNWLLMPRILVAARRLDQILRAIRAEPPDGVLAIPVLRHRDVQHIDTLALHAR